MIVTCHASLRRVLWMFRDVVVLGMIKLRVLGSQLC